MIRLVGLGARFTEHLLESHHQSGRSGLILSMSQKVVDPEPLFPPRDLAIAVGAGMCPAVFDIQTGCVRVQDQMPPVAAVLRRTGGYESKFPLEGRHWVPPDVGSDTR